MFSFAPARAMRRRPNLTPMIDVVFLLLVFFMLASQFGQPQALQIDAAGVAGSYTGPPRLVDIGPANLTLNGAPVGTDDLAAALDPLMHGPDDTIVVRPAEGVSVQRLIDIVETLRAAGLTHLAIVE